MATWGRFPWLLGGDFQDCLGQNSMATWGKFPRLPRVDLQDCCIGEIYKTVAGGRFPR